MKRYIFVRSQIKVEAKDEKSAWQKLEAIIKKGFQDRNPTAEVNNRWCLEGRGEEIIKN